MMMFKSYIIILSIVSGLVLTKPIKNINNEKTSQDISTQQVFRQAEMTLNRYFQSMKSDTDRLVHALLLMLINNPKSFPLVPNRTLDIALKNFEKKLGKNNLDILIKPIFLSMEQNALNKSNQPSSFQLTDEIKHEIEDALDKFLEEQEDSSDI